MPKICKSFAKVLTLAFYKVIIAQVGNLQLICNLLFIIEKDLFMQRHYHSKGSYLVENYAREHQESAFSAKQVVDYAKEQNVNINTATIYRNLEKMASEGMLLKTKGQESDSVFYQFVSEHIDCHNHLHARCRNCGKILHLEHDTCEMFFEHMMKKYNFTIQADMTTICGLCEDCRKGA